DKQKHRAGDGDRPVKIFQNPEHQGPPAQCEWTDGDRAQRCDLWRGPVVCGGLECGTEAAPAAGAEQPPEKGYISYVRDLMYHPSRADELRGPASPHAVARPEATRAVDADRPRSNGSERPHPPNGFRRDIRSARSVSSCRSPC